MAVLPLHHVVQSLAFVGLRQNGRRATSVIVTGFPMEDLFLRKQRKQKQRQDHTKEHQLELLDQLLS